MNRSIRIATLVLAALGGTSAVAADQHEGHHPPASGGASARPDGPSSAVPVDLTEAEVRKVDAANGKITLKHGEIRNLDMPPMTMVFKVKDAAMLGQVKVGDKVRFAAEKGGSGGYVVTHLTLAP